MGAKRITADSADAIKKQVIDFMTSCDEPGMTMTKVIAKCKVAHSTFYDIRAKDEKFKEQCETLLAKLWERNIDFVESKVFERINGVKVQGAHGVYDLPPDVTACALILNGRAKHRGYGQHKVALSNDGDNPLKISFDSDFKKTK